MRLTLLVCAFLIATCVVAAAQSGSADDIRGQVQRLCDQGNGVSAFHLAMKTLLNARQQYGAEDPRTAECLVTVADVAKHREKYHLAEVLYRKALSIDERALGAKHPDVMHCKVALFDLHRIDRP